MSNLLEKSSRFQEDYARYQSIIEEMPEGDFKQDVSQLLKKLVGEIKKLDSMHMEMVYTRQLPSMGGDMKQGITAIRRQLENKIKDYQQSKK
jgi:RNase P/RNase MRP subunit POP5